MVKYLRGGNRMNKILWIFGIGLALFSAFLMGSGKIFGEDITGIAIVVGIIGLTLIATSRKCMIEKSNKNHNQGGTECANQEFIL